MKFSAIGILVILSLSMLGGILLVLPQTAHGQPTIFASESNACSFTLTCSVFLSTQTGDGIIVECVVDTGDGISISDFYNLDWTDRGGYPTDFGIYIDTFAAVAANSMGDTITCGIAGFVAYGSINIVAFDVTNIVTSDSITFDPDVSLPSTNQGSSSSPSCTMTTSNADDLLLAWVATNTTSTSSIPSDFTSIQSSTSNTPYIESDYNVTSSTQSGVSENWTLGSPDNWAAWCDAIEESSEPPTTVVQPMVCVMEDSPPYIVNATLSDSDSSLNSTSLYCDGNTNYYSVDANAMVTISLPAPNSTQEYAFNDTADMQTFTACASDTCSPVTYYVYYLVNNTYQITAKAASAFDVGLSAAFDDYTLDIPVCSIASTTATATNSCSGFSSYGNPVTAEQYLGNSGSHIQWQNAAGSSSTVATPTSYGNTYNVNYYKQVEQKFAYAISGGGSGYSAPVLTCTYLGSSISCDTITTSLVYYYADYSSTWTLTNPLTGSSGTERWDANTGTSGTITAGGSQTTTYYNQYFPTLQITAEAHSTFDTSMTLAITGTQFGSSGQTICTITTTAASTDSCQGWVDVSTSVTFAQYLSSPPSNTQWQNAAGSPSTQSITSAGTYNVDYYSQLTNTYEATPLSPDTWNANGDITVTGTFLGSGSTTICTIDVVSGDGEASCTGYADYDTEVTVTSPVTLSVYTWTETGGNTFTQTTGANTNNVDYNGVGAATQPIKITVASSGTTSHFTISGCSASPTSIATDGSTHDISVSGSCELTITVKSDNATARYRFDNSSSASTTYSFDTCSSGTCSLVSITVYLQFYNTFEISASSPITNLDSGLSVSFLGTAVSVSGSTICSISSTSGSSSSASCEGWADYDTDVVFPQYLTGSGSNIRWQNEYGSSSGSRTIVIGGGGSTYHQYYYKQVQNTYAANPSTPSTWNAAGSTTATGSLLGVTGQTICTITISSGGGSASCTGYSDANASVSLPATITLSSIPWAVSGTHSWTDTTGGNTRTANYNEGGGISVTVTTIPSGPSGEGDVTLSGCSVSPTTIAANGSPHVVTATADCTIKVAAPSGDIAGCGADAANCRFVFNQDGIPHSNWYFTTCSGTCSESNDMYFQQAVTADLQPDQPWTGTATVDTFSGYYLGTWHSSACSVSFHYTPNNQDCTSNLGNETAPDSYLYLDSGTLFNVPEQITINGTIWVSVDYGSGAFINGTGGRVNNGNFSQLVGSFPTSGVDDTGIIEYVIGQGSTGTVQSSSCTGSATHITIPTPNPDTWSKVYDVTCTLSDTITTGNIYVLQGVINSELNSGSISYTLGGNNVDGGALNYTTSQYFENGIPGIELTTGHYLPVNFGGSVSSGGTFSLTFTIWGEANSTGYINLSWSIHVMEITGYTIYNGVHGHGLIGTTTTGSGASPATITQHAFVSPGAFLSMVVTTTDDSASLASTTLPNGGTFSALYTGHALSAYSLNFPGLLSSYHTFGTFTPADELTVVDPISFELGPDPATVTLPLKIDVVGGAPTATLSIVGCGVTNSSFTGDAFTHTYANLTASCDVTVSVPSDDSFTRYRFNDSATSLTIETCPAYGSGMCGLYVSDYYYQVKNTLEITPYSPDEWNGAYHVNITGFFVGSDTNILVLNTTNHGSAVSSTAWSEYDQVITFPSIFFAWSATPPVTFTATTGDNTYNVDYTLVIGTTTFCASYILLGGGTNFGQPVLSYTYNNQSLTKVLSFNTVCVKADTGSSYNVTNPLPGSTSSERGISNQATSSFIPVNATTIRFLYYTQYYVYFSYTLADPNTVDNVPQLSFDYFGVSYTHDLNLTASPAWFDGLTLWNATNPLITHPDLKSWIPSPSGQLFVTAENIVIHYNTPKASCSVSFVTDLINGCEFYGAAGPYYSLLGPDFVIGFIAICISIALYLDTKSGLLALTPLIAGLAVFGDTLPVELQLFIYAAAAVAIVAILFKAFWSRT